MTTSLAASSSLAADGDDIAADCGRCRGTGTAGSGWVIITKRVDGYPFPLDFGAKCDCFGRIEKMRMIRGAQIPRVLLEKSLRGFEGKGAEYEAVRSDVRAYLRGRLGKPGLLLRGCTGSGKSHVAAHVLKAQIDGALRAGLWANYPEIFQELRAIYGAGDSAVEPEETFLGVFRTVPFLVMDDLGITDANVNQRDTVAYKIINARLEANLPTVVTTNLGDADLQERIGERSVSRLWAMCSVIDFPDVDYRRQAA